MSTPIVPKIYAPHVRLTLIGSLGALGGSLERFSIGLNLTGASAFIVQLNQFITDSLAADARAFWADARNGIGSRAKLDTVKTARIGVNGKYLADPFINSFPPVGGAAVGVDHPFQVSMGVSFVTARRGPTGKGRIYLPCPVLAVAGDGTIGAGTADAVAAAVAQFLNNLNNSPGIDAPGPQVVISSSKGYVSPVTGVRCGRVLDTVRSRRAQLVENYGTPIAVV